MNTIFKPLILSVVIPFCCIFWSCKEETKTPDVGNIYGIVTIKNTGEPMRATGVELYRYTPKQHTSQLQPLLLNETVTFDDGHFEFNDLETGYLDFFDDVVSYTYMIRVNAAGYKELTRDVIVDPGRTSRMDMQLEATGKHLTVVTLVPEDEVNCCVTFYGSFYATSSSWNPYIVGFEYWEKDSYSSKKTHPTTVKPNFQAYIHLNCGKTYVVRAYAENSMGTVYGDEIVFSVK